VPVTHKTDIVLPLYDPAEDYDALSSRLAEDNALASQQLQSLILEHQNILNKLEKYEGSTSCEKNLAQIQKKKRHRRSANEIERHFICEECEKSYGSEGSLNQHIKLKHPTAITTKPH
jgi:hypothetical protein